jgi:hypothetical protein
VTSSAGAARHRVPAVHGHHASGVVLTFLVTFGGIGLAGAASSIISAPEHAGHDRSSAHETTLQIFAFLSAAASLIVMVVRQVLVRRGLMQLL